jgi:hypothetical protein
MSAKEPDKEMLRLYEMAFAEFSRDGKVASVRCDKCGGLIQVRALGSLGSAWAMSCPCGRFKDTLRGI